MPSNSAYQPLSYKPSSYQIGFGINPFNNLLYNHASDFVNNVASDSQTIWDREDSAYQRMVEDMKKAGLNPWTGISSGGLSTSSTNPSLDSLTGLLSVLDSMSKGESTFTQSSSRLVDQILNFLTLGFGFAKS